MDESLEEMENWSTVLRLARDIQSRRISWSLGRSEDECACVACIREEGSPMWWVRDEILRDCIRQGGRMDSVEGVERAVDVGMSRLIFGDCGVLARYVLWLVALGMVEGINLGARGVDGMREIVCREVRNG